MARHGTQLAAEHDVAGDRTLRRGCRARTARAKRLSPSTAITCLAIVSPDSGVTSVSLARKMRGPPHRAPLGRDIGQRLQQPVRRDCRGGAPHSRSPRAAKRGGLIVAGIGWRDHARMRDGGSAPECRAMPAGRAAAPTPVAAPWAIGISPLRMRQTFRRRRRLASLACGRERVAAPAGTSSRPASC